MRFVCPLLYAAADRRSQEERSVIIKCMDTYRGACDFVIDTGSQISCAQA